MCSIGVLSLVQLVSRDMCVLPIRLNLVVYKRMHRRNTALMDFGLVSA